MTAADFDPDQALDVMTAFLTSGVRTVSGYALFADTMRDLSTHLAAGGRLPVQWHWAADPTRPSHPDDDMLNPGSLMRLRVMARDWATVPSHPVLRAAGEELASWVRHHAGHDAAMLEHLNADHARLRELTVLTAEMLVKAEYGAPVDDACIRRWQAIVDGTSG